MTTIGYGFAATMTALPGKGDEVVEVLLSGLEPGNPASTEFCLLYLVSRSASNPDVIFIQEGWSSEDDHQRIFSGPAAQAIVARFDGLLAGDSVYTDPVVIGGKALI